MPPKIRPTKTKRSGVIISGRPSQLSEPARRFLRGLLVLILGLGSLVALSARGQINYTGAYYFNTFAGAAIGADGTGKLALFDRPNSTAVDSAGNVYVADFNDQTVRKITPAGVVTTLAGFAGDGEVSDRDGMGVDARLFFPTGIALDSAGNVYVTEQQGYTIRKITPAGVVSTLAGTFGVSGSADGTGSAASFYYPCGIAVDSGGNVYVSEILNQTIRKITPAGVVTTIAGAARVAGSTDGPGAVARFSNPADLAIDSTGNLYVADNLNSTIRKIVLGSSMRDITVSTFAGTAGVVGNSDGTGAAASFNSPYGLSVDRAGNVYVADTYNHSIRKITSARVVSTFAGTAGIYGAADGTGSAAQFNTPTDVTVNSAGTLLYVADYGNNEIRKVTSRRVVSTLAGSVHNPPGGVGNAEGTGRAARFGKPYGIALAGTTVYFADANHTIHKITSNGVVTTLAGTPGVAGSADGIGTVAQFSSPLGVAADSKGNVYVADLGNGTIRKIVAATGVVTTLAGTAGVVGYADGIGPAAQFAYPESVAVDSAGSTVYVADTFNQVVRKINVSTGAVTTLAGYQPDGVVEDVDGTGSNARLNFPGGIAVDKNGNVYVTELSGNTIRKITAGGVVTTLAGTVQANGNYGSADGTGPAAGFYSPWGIAVDAKGMLYVADYGNYTIRKITPTGGVTTLGGVPGSNGMKDATGSGARFFLPTYIASDANGKIYIADWNNGEIRTGVLADLKITCTDGKTSVATGSINTYTITVTNTGLENLNGTVVTDTFPAQVQNVSYTATGKSGATGFSAGSGNISQSLNLPPNSSVTYKATGFINGNSGTVVSNTANVSVPAGITDPNTADNTATDKDTIQ
jgi:uncharacterized repeat protein (TIGR01451 family)